MSSEELKHNPQKKVWEDTGTYKTYAEAKEKSDSIERESKVRRCGNGGCMFKVKVVKKYLEER